VAKTTAPKAAAKKPAAAKAAPAAKATKAAKTGATVTLRQIKSGAGRSVSQNATLVGLGLRRIGKVSTVEDTAATRGMIKKVAHLITIVDAA
jgi:large subunit ribosomal protein L30